MENKICPDCGYSHSFSLCPCKWVDLTPHLLQKRYGLATIDDLKSPAQVALIKEIKQFLRAGNAAGIILNGPSGAGKTHTAIAICKALGKKYKIISKLSKLPSTSDEEHIDAIIPPVLIIDEIETVHYEIVRARTERGNFTIGTTNDLKLDERFYAWRMGIFEMPPANVHEIEAIRNEKVEAIKKWYSFKNPPKMSDEEYKEKMRLGNATYDDIMLRMECWQRDDYMREMKQKRLDEPILERVSRFWGESSHA
jgi:hypothetical protein